MRILFAQECIAHHVPCALHIFAKGDHGLSLANKDLANGNFGEAYVTEQMQMVIANLAANGTTLPPFDESLMPKLYESKEIQVWPDLADTFLKTVLT